MLRRALRVGGLALAVFTAFTTAASAHTDSCDIGFDLANDVTFITLQFDVSYASADGEFVGEGGSVHCVNQSPADVGTFEDDDPGRTLSASFLTSNGVQGPRRLAKCRFVAEQEPAPDDFGITVVDATGPYSQPIDAEVAVGTISCRECGDANDDDRITATDALLALKTAVGAGSCPVSVCDANGDGSIKAGDGLLILKAAIGIQVVLRCESSGGTTTTTFTTTTTLLPARLVVTKTGSGTVTSDPAGIDCGSDCEEFYAPGTSVTLTATAASGSHFAGWSGACSGTGTCEALMVEDRDVTATFNKGPAPCPTDGPITDLRNDCREYVYLYFYSPEGLGEGLATTGTDVVVAQSDGVDILGYTGPVTGARTFTLTHVSLNQSPFYPLLDPGSGGDISSDGHTLNLTIKLDGETYAFNGATWVETQPLMVVRNLSAAVSAMCSTAPQRLRAGSAADPTCFREAARTAASRY